MKRRNSMRDHLALLVRTVVDEESRPSIRAAAARGVAETALDVRTSLQAGLSALSGSWVLDSLQSRDGVGDAVDRMRLRGELARELRDLDVASFGGLLPTNVVSAEVSTGYGPLPLIRTIAGQWSDDLVGVHPVVPSFPEAGEWAGVDLELPVDATDPPTGVAVIDAADGSDGRHLASLTFEVSRQTRDFLTPTGVRLLDDYVLDEVDLAAELWVADALRDEAATAGGTRAAGADVGGALDDAEGAAGARGPLAFVVVNAQDLPAVRRALAATFFDGPHPPLYVSAGQPQGTATFVGRDAILFVTADHQTMEADIPRGWARVGFVGRPFFFMVKDPALIQTVTGIGA